MSGRYGRAAIKTILILFVLMLSITFNCFSHTFAVPQRAHTNYYRVPGIAVSLQGGLLAGGALANRTAENKILHLSIALTPRNQDALDTLLVEQSNPASPLYHHYLTPNEFKNQFGQTPAVLESVAQYLTSEHFNITSISSNNLLLNVTSSVSVANKAFEIVLNNYALGDRVAFAPNLNPAVPNSMVPFIQNITGLDDVVTYKPHILKIPHKASMRNTGPGGGYTPSELRTAYDVNPLINAGATGSGQTVGIFELDGYNPADINTYLSNYNLGTSKYSNVLVDGATNTAGNGAVEVTLDMEIVSALAPNAAQKIYIGPNSSGGVNDLYSKIVTDNIAKVVSTSWGQCEASSGNAELATLNNIFRQGAAQGQSFFAASGDSGAYDCGDSSLAVDSPADQPYVVGVGGTKLTAGSGGTYSSEAAWSTTSNSQQAGGGGGVSSYFTRPAYQSGANLTLANRMVPDVSADADPASGYSIYCSGSGTYCDGWGVIGGTSAAAPLWAGIAADSNQYLLSQNKPSLGNVNAALYTLYSTPQPYASYHDVTSGMNLHYQATTGYDMATGIGSLDAWNIVRDLAGTVITASTPTPTVNPVPTVTPTPSATPGGFMTQLLQNGDFEHGNMGWWQRSARGYSFITPTNPHAGKYSVAFCSYANCNDELYQSINLPYTMTHALLSYWVYTGSGNSSTACSSNLYVILRTTRGDPIALVNKLCNTNLSGWSQYTFDLSTVLARNAGQPVQLYFNARSSNQKAAPFYVDDVAFNVTSSS